MTAQVFTYEVQVRWSDSDRLGHVNNTRFVEYLQEGRVQFLNATLRGGGARGATVVRKLTTDFLRPILDDSGPMTIALSVTEIGTSSFGIRHVISDRAGAVCAEADAVMVAFDLESNSSRPLTEPERDALTRYVVT